MNAALAWAAGVTIGLSTLAAAGASPWWPPVVLAVLTAGLAVLEDRRRPHPRGGRR